MAAERHEVAHMAMRRPALFLAAVLSFIAAGESIGAQPAAAIENDTVVDVDYARPVDGPAGLYITKSNGEVQTPDGLPHFGDRPPLETGETVIALSTRPEVDGYWLFTSKGRAFAFGGAPFLGDASELALAAPMISAIATPDGRGYYMVAQDGGIFSFGSAQFYGSIPQVLPGVPLAAPVIGIAASSTGAGYVLVASDGGIFTFGDAVFFGSVPGVLPGVTLTDEVVGVVAQQFGYLMVAADGGIFAFGQAPFHGSLGGTGASGITSVAVRPDNSGYIMIDTRGTLAPFGDTHSLGTVDEAINPAADVALIEGVWRGLSENWVLGPESAISFIASHNYIGLAKTVATCGALLEAVPAGYRQEFIIDTATVRPDVEWVIPDGPNAGQRPLGRIYVMSALLIERAPGFQPNSSVLEVHVTIDDGQARFFYNCA